MDVKLSNAQVDRLGERLRMIKPTEEDFRLLDQYRRSFVEPYEYVVKQLRETLNLEPTGRPAKSTSSVRDKLQRESIRLSQMQDIAGCRVIVEDISSQERVIKEIGGFFVEIAIVDRRQNPSYGYRAVHAIVKLDGKPIEVQIRTRIQHRWAEYSEKLADVFDPAVKYGGGPSEVSSVLNQLSELIKKVEASEMAVSELSKQAEQLDLDDESRETLIRLRDSDLRQSLESYLEKSISDISRSTS